MTQILMAWQSSTAAGAVTAIATALTALFVLLTSVISFNVQRTTRKTERKVDEATVQLGAVHTIVNQQRTDQQRYQIALVELLKKHGITVPIDQSLPVTGQVDADK